MGEIYKLTQKYKEMGLTKQKIEGILEWYRIGRGEDKIKSFFGISQETLVDVVKCYGENNIETIRNGSLSKWEQMPKIKNPMGQPKKGQSKEETNGAKLSREERIKNLAKAIINVEREGDER